MGQSTKEEEEVMNAHSNVITGAAISLLKSLFCPGMSDPCILSQPHPQNFILCKPLAMSMATLQIRTY